jgi:hypothetical protein
MERTRVDVLFVAKGFGGASGQRINVVDNLADVIGNSSGGI